MILRRLTQAVGKNLGGQGIHGKRWGEREGKCGGVPPRESRSESPPWGGGLGSGLAREGWATPSGARLREGIPMR
jgi:hypothetical protein